jgi:hypothetical protein
MPSKNTNVDAGANSFISRHRKKETFAQLTSGGDKTLGDDRGGLYAAPWMRSGSTKCGTS